MFYFHFLNIYQSWSIIISFKNIETKHQKKNTTCQINEPKRKTSNSFFWKKNEQKANTFKYIYTGYIYTWMMNNSQPSTVEPTTIIHFSMGWWLHFFPFSFQGSYHPPGISLKTGNGNGNGDVTYFIVECWVQNDTI